MQQNDENSEILNKRKIWNNRQLLSAKKLTLKLEQMRDDFVVENKYPLTIFSTGYRSKKREIENEYIENHNAILPEENCQLPDCKHDEHKCLDISNGQKVEQLAEIKFKKPKQGKSGKCCQLI